MNPELDSYFDELNEIQNDNHVESTFEKYILSEEFRKTYVDYYNKILTFEQTETLSSYHKFHPGGKAIFKFPIHGERYAYKNLRLKHKRHEKIVYRWDLELGGTRVDWLFKDIVPQLRELYKAPDNSIPFHILTGKSYLPQADYHEIWIEVEFLTHSELEEMYVSDFDVLAEDFELLVDVYSYDGISDFQFPINNLQFKGEEELYSSIEKIRLNYNNYISHILIKDTGVIHRILLFIDGRKVDTEFCQSKINEYYVITFSKSLKGGINFSRIDNATIVLERNEEEGLGHFYAVSQNLIWIRGGVYGLTLKN